MHAGSFIGAMGLADLLGWNLVPRPGILYIGRQILNHWTTKEVPGLTPSWCVNKAGVCACISEDQPHTTEYSDFTEVALPYGSLVGIH